MPISARVTRLDATRLEAALETTVAGAIGPVFDFVTAEGVLPVVLTGYGPLPPVVSTSGHTGPWDQPGSIRTVHLADGTAAREQVTDFEPPSYFAYRIDDFTFALKHVATGAEGRWWFTETPEGTHIRWTYTYQAKSAVASVLVEGFMRAAWVGYMRVCLQNVARHFA